MRSGFSQIQALPKKEVGFLNGFLKLGFVENYGLSILYGWNKSIKKLKSRVNCQVEFIIC